MPPNNPFVTPQNQGGGQAPAPASAFPQPPAQQPVPAPGPVGSGPNTQKPAAPTPSNPNSTQSTLLLSEIRDSMVIMADGSFRAVVQCQSINFDLMSDAEREGVEFSYQNFLNSLNFPVQIVIRSQRIDIGPYIEKLVTARRNQDNMLLGVLMDNYINFIDVLSQEVNIMDKSFFIVVPFFPQGTASNVIERSKGFFSSLFAQPKNTITKINAADYQKAKDEIKNRIDTVMSGLFQIGIQSAQLDTQSLGKLYYNFYNSDTAVRQPLTDFEKVTSVYVRKETPSEQQQGAA
ncbi:MAG TPA: hypothetical protein PLY16_01245 [Candidatus Saccharibacteria bacterium]|nr:hypothetical protein [Candidatus Saccharibacteria bacterium]